MLPEYRCRTVRTRAELPAWQSVQEVLKARAPRKKCIQEETKETEKVNGESRRFRLTRYQITAWPRRGYSSGQPYDYETRVSGDAQDKHTGTQHR